MILPEVVVVLPVMVFIAGDCTTGVFITGVFITGDCTTGVFITGVFITGDCTTGESFTGGVGVSSFG